MEPYISKSALVAEIKKKIKQYENAFDNPSFASYEACLIAKGKYRKLLDILSFIDTLEVKEVDLNAAVERYVEQHKSELNGYFDIRRIVRHFFELGLKAKGE